MNRFLAKLFPGYFRRGITIDMPLADWFEFREMLNHPSKPFAAGDKFNLVDENTGTVITFNLMPDKEPVEAETSTNP